MQRASFWSWLDVVDDYYWADLGDLENVNLIVGREYPFHPKLYRVSAEGETDVSDDPDGYYRFNSYGTFEFYQDGESLGFEGVVDLGAEITIVPMYDGELYLELNFYDAYVQSFELHADYCRHEDVVYENGYPATCTEPGYTDGVYCPTCGEVTAQEEIPALGHDWNDGEIVIDGEGKTEKVYTCGVCGERYSELIPDTDDNLKISCTSVTLKNDLSMNFYVNPDDSQDVEIDYLLVTKDIYDAAGNVIDTVTLRIDHYTVRDGYRVYTFPNISAKEMTAKLTAELFGTNSDGSEYHGQAVRTSVQRYAMQLLNPEATGTEAQLLNKTVVNMLLYGDRAQEYMNYNLTHKASSGLTADALALAGNEAVTYEGHMGLTGTGRKDVKFNSVALVLRNKAS